MRTFYFGLVISLLYIYGRVMVMRQQILTHMHTVECFDMSYPVSLCITLFVIILDNGIIDLLKPFSVWNFVGTMFQGPG